MKRENVFTKADEFVKWIRERIPEAMFHDCRRWTGRLANNYYYRKKPKKNYRLTEEELIVHDILLEKKLSPTTAYRWLILCSSPEDVQQLLKQKKISIKDAFKENKYRSKYQGSVYPSKKRYHEMQLSAFYLFIDDMIGNP